MKIRYEDWKPGADARAIVRMADQICREYEAQGYDLTLRQLYYQFVSRDLIPNNQRSYDRLGEFVNRGRMAGLIDWNHITDRTRNLKSITHYDDPADIIDVATRAYRVDLWEGQPRRVEVWVEKEALAGVVQRAADSRDCAWFSCRGYVSQSEMWAAAQRIGGYIAAGQAVTILHLGDHDPSGIDMTRDIRDRLTSFITQDHLNANADMADGSYYVHEIMSSIREGLTDPSIDSPFTVDRIALNRDQVDEYDPPPNPAKMSDSRAESYVAEHGNESWELDALEPSVLNALITDHIDELLEHDAYEARDAYRRTGTAQLNTVAARWDEVVELVEQ